MYSYAATKQGYINLWSKAVVQSKYLQGSRNWANRITSGKSRYINVQNSTGVFWAFIGLLHMREGSCDFSTYLGNGEPLNHTTTLVPKGRGPFPTFEDGAIDALKYEGFIGITDWPISRILWAGEVFNGLGYISHDVNDPYLWSWTNLYNDPPWPAGKFTGDGFFNANAVDEQPGLAAVLGSLIVSNQEIAAYLAAYKEEPVADVPFTPVPTPMPIPTPTPTPPVPTIDPYAPIIAMLKQVNRWPGEASINITTTGAVQVVINGHTINTGG